MKSVKITIILLTMIFLFGINASAQDEAVTFEGTLQIGKTDSVILYFGMESGDYAAYCFKNDSAVGRVILNACKDDELCQFTGKVVDSPCQVPGLEADLSASGKIVSVEIAMEPETEHVIQCTVVTEGGNLNVRDIASAHGKVIDRLKNNTLVTLIEQTDEGWAYVSVIRKDLWVAVGWVSSDFLSCSAH